GGLVRAPGADDAARRDVGRCAQAGAGSGPGGTTADGLRAHGRLAPRTRFAGTARSARRQTRPARAIAGGRRTAGIWSRAKARRRLTLARARGSKSLPARHFRGVGRFFPTLLSSGKAPRIAGGN